jgi:hypothetical protein
MNAISFSSRPHARKNGSFKNIRDLITRAHIIASDFRQKEAQLIEVLQQLDHTKALAIKNSHSNSSRDENLKSDVELRDPTTSSSSLREKVSATSRAPSKKRTPIPSATRHQIWLRDKGQCRYHLQGKRCKNRNYLEIHHKTPVCVGGSHAPENLVLICSEHHKAIHSR